jgi:hypothetical protein
MMPTTSPTRMGVSAVGYIIGTRSNACRHHGCATARSSLGWCFLQGRRRRQHERCLGDFGQTPTYRWCTVVEQRHDNYRIRLQVRAAARAGTWPQAMLCCSCKASSMQPCTHDSGARTLSMCHR